MKVEKRKENILKRLSESSSPVSASSLATEFGVSRQIIVKDISRIRADGVPVISHPRGYMLQLSTKPKKVFKVIHSDEDVKTELNLIVDYGGVVEDVFVYHKFYNKVTAPLNIKSRIDVENFLDEIKTGKSSLLKNVTAGYHYHTVSTDSLEALEIIEQKLWEYGFLAPLQKYEPDEMTGHLTYND